MAQFGLQFSIPVYLHAQKCQSPLVILTEQEICTITVSMNYISLAIYVIEQTLYLNLCEILCWSLLCPLDAYIIWISFSTVQSSVQLTFWEALMYHFCRSECIISVDCSNICLKNLAYWSCTACETLQRHTSIAKLLDSISALVWYGHSWLISR